MKIDISDFHTKAKAALKHFAEEVSQLRTGKASVQLLDSVRVPVYGSDMKLNEVANVSAPDANLLTVEPWDKNIMEDIEKAIASAELNLNPVVDNDIIRIVVPPLTQERRKEMVKKLEQRLEQAKIMLRKVRTESKQEIEEFADEDGVSEDDIREAVQHLDQQLKDYTQKLEDMRDEKEEELMKI
jgi:ribosome recycling factor